MQSNSVWVQNVANAAPYWKSNPRARAGIFIIFIVIIIIILISWSESRIKRRIEIKIYDTNSTKFFSSRNPMAWLFSG